MFASFPYSKRVILVRFQFSDIFSVDINKGAWLFFFAKIFRPLGKHIQQFGQVVNFRRLIWLLERYFLCKKHNYARVPLLSCA